MSTTTTQSLADLASKLNVDVSTLAALGVERVDDAWRIPERDSKGIVVGYARRFDDGGKRFVKGGHRGLTMRWPIDPKAGQSRDNPILLPEGFTDTATADHHGFTAIGRPSATGGAAKIKRLVRNRHAVVVGENDGGAGHKGAESIGQAIANVAASVRIVYPPHGVKDLREWCSGEFGADRAEIMAAIEAAPYIDIPTDIEFTDSGNAGRFVRMYGDRVLYVPAWKIWLYWDGKRWTRDERMIVQRWAGKCVASIVAEAQGLGPGHERYKQLIDWGKTSADEPRIRRMLELAKNQLAITPADLDKNQSLFNTASCTIDLRTGETYPHDPADRITKLSPVEYDGKADCPLWLATLDRIMGGDAGLIEFLKRLFGLCLTGHVVEQILAVFHGVGANGKSLTMDTITGIMGDYAGQAPPDLLMVRHGDEHPTEIADLFGRRLVVASETEEGRKLRIQLVKKLTGDATLKGRFMRADYFEFQRTFKTILVTNNAPVVTESSNAIWRRLKLIPFEVVIPPDEQDRDLLAKLRAEWPGILAWAVEGCLAWQFDGLKVPDKVTDATAEYRDQQDVLAPFIEEKCLLSDGCRVPRNELWATWQSWADRTGDRSHLSRNGFYDRVRALPGVTDDTFTVAGRTCRGFKGLGLCN